MDESNTLLAEHYVLVPRFIAPERASALAIEFAEAERKGRYIVDAQAPKSPAVYNFLPFVRLLIEKLPQVCELVGEQVLPTYAYARSYKHGEILRRHRDRDACEISFTLNLAHDVDWPIHIQKPGGEEVAFNLDPGDAVMYLGCETDHWREPYTGERHMQLFMHYVRSYGPRAYTFFNLTLTPPDEDDKAPSLEDSETKLDQLPASGKFVQHPGPFTGQFGMVGRNALCPCGSGKRFKHCHGTLTGVEALPHWSKAGKPKAS